MEKARLGFDVALLVLYIVPALFFLILSFFCGGWNAGTGSGRCSVAILEPIYENLYNTVFALTFMIGPVYLIAILATIVGSIGFRLMSLSEGLIAVKKDWFGFLVLGISVFLFILSI